jgi:hypothetical protein
MLVLVLETQTSNAQRSTPNAQRRIIQQSFREQGSRIQYPVSGINDPLNPRNPRSFRHFRVDFGWCVRQS